MTPLLKPRYNLHSQASVSDIFNSGEVSRNELLQDLTIASDYYQRPISKEHAIEFYRKLTATHHLKDSALAEKSYVFGIFGQDCVDEQLTAAQLDWAITKWRKGDNSFAPTFGQLLTMIREGGYSTPTQADYKSYQIRVQSVIDPNYTAPPKSKPAYAGIRQEPEPPTAPKTTPAERKALVEKLDAKMKRAVAMPAAEFGNAEKEHRRNLFRAQAAHRVEILTKKTPEGGPDFFAVVAFDKSGESKTPLGQFISRADAEAFLTEAAQ